MQYYMQFLSVWIHFAKWSRIIVILFTNKNKNKKPTTTQNHSKLVHIGDGIRSHAWTSKLQKPCVMLYKQIKPSSHLKHNIATEVVGRGCFGIRITTRETTKVIFKDCRTPWNWIDRVLMHPSTCTHASFRVALYAIGSFNSTHDLLVSVFDATSMKILPLNG